MYPVTGSPATWSEAEPDAPSSGLESLFPVSPVQAVLALQSLSTFNLSNVWRVRSPWTARTESASRRSPNAPVQLNPLDFAQSVAHDCVSRTTADAQANGDAKLEESREHRPLD